MKISSKKYFLPIIITLPFVVLSLRIFFSDFLEVYDAPGHLAAIWCLKNYLWPSFSGWNSFSLLGYEQGLLYPPLFHWLAASFSFAFELVTATKLLTLFSLLILPFSIYLLVSSLVASKKEKIFLTSSLLLAWAVLPGYLGADLKSLLQVGLLPSFFSLPFIFFYFVSLKKLQKGHYLIPSLILSIIILTHLVAGIFSLLFLIIFTVINFYLPREEEFNFREFSKTLLIHLLLTAGLTAFFWVPFLFNLESLSTSVHISSLGLANVIAFLLASFFSFVFFKKREKFLLAISLVVVVLSGLNLIDFSLTRFYSQGFIFEKIYNLHLYRYQIYSYLFLLILIIYFPIKLLFSLKEARLNPGLVSLLPFLVLVFVVIFKPPFLINQAKITVTSNDAQGRFLEIFRRVEAYPFVYSGQSQLVIDKNLPWAYGLFTDATPNGPYLGSLIKTLTADPNEKSGRLIEEKILDQKRTVGLFNLFGIENLLFIKNTDTKVSEGLDLGLAPIAPQSLVEVPDLKIRTIAKSEDWGRQLEEWWTKSGSLEELLIKTGDKNLPAGADNVAADLTDHNRNFTNFKIKINSSYEVPVLVKFSYSSSWQALQGGKKIKIYQTSPNLMMVFAKGEVDFSYRQAWYQQAALWLSFFSLLFFVFQALKIKK